MSERHRARSCIFSRSCMLRRKDDSRRRRRRGRRRQAATGTQYIIPRSPIIIMTSQVSCRTMGLVAASYFELILPAVLSFSLPLRSLLATCLRALPSSSTSNKVTLAGMRFRDKLSKFIRPTLSMSLPSHLPPKAAHHAPPFYERFKFFEFSGKCCVKLIERYGWHAVRQSHALNQVIIRI